MRNDNTVLSFTDIFLNAYLYSIEDIKSKCKYVYLITNSEQYASNSLVCFLNDLMCLHSWVRKGKAITSIALVCKIFKEIVSTEAFRKKAHYRWLDSN